MSKSERDGRDQDDIDLQLRPAPIIKSPDDERFLESFVAEGVYRIRVVNRPMQQIGKHDEGVADCDIVLGTLQTQTNEFGNASLDISSLPDGTHILSVVAPDVADVVVGPNFPDDPSKERVWRPYEVLLVKTASQLEPVDSSAHVSISGTRITASLTPLWMRSHASSSRSGPIDIVVIHHTGGNNLRSDLRTLLYSGNVSAHYLVAPDGFTYKLVDERRRSWHAGYAHWSGNENINDRSIGIEITHGTGREYPQEQVDAVTVLIERMLSAFGNIPVHRIIGHSDTAINRPENRPPKRHGRKSTDPGSAFQWERIEAHEWGLIPSPGTLPVAAFGGFFAAFPNGKFRSGDNDASQTYGGTHQPNVEGAIAELQTDLKTIGYHVGTIDGNFGTITRWALQMFQQHIFSGSRRTDEFNSGDGRCDRQTAEMIKRTLGQADPPLVG